MKYTERKNVCRVNVVLEEETEEVMGRGGCKLSGECQGYNGEELDALIVNSAVCSAIVLNH